MSFMSAGRCLSGSEGLIHDMGVADMINVMQDFSKMAEPMPTEKGKDGWGNVKKSVKARVQARMKENAKPKDAAQGKQATGKDELGSKATLQA